MLGATKTKPKEKQNISGVSQENTPGVFSRLISDSLREWSRGSRFKILAGILGVLVLAGSIFSAYKLSQRPTQPVKREVCVKTDTGEEMTLSEAKEIALESECVKGGSLKEEHFCNESTGTWWIDLDIQKEGCAPACVVKVATKKAEINWRCTGLIPQKQRVFCKDPRPQLCTMECIVNPPYICGSDGKSYCSTCQACSNSEVEWYVIQDAPCED